MDTFHKLTDLFLQFPGIGPRQAKRFVFFLLRRDDSFRGDLAALIAALKKEIAPCASCFRFFEKRHSSLCALCSDKNRYDSELMIVATDTDLDAVEKSGTFRGRYFVLGGTIPFNEQKTARRIRLKELTERVSAGVKGGALKEIVLALSANPDGEHTAQELKKLLASLSVSAKITELGRGLSTGSELEYADPETIKSALKNRG